MHSALTDETLLKIRSKGLSVLSMHRGNYLVLKPFRTQGNSIPGRQVWFKNEAGEEEFSDAPSVEIWPIEAGWEMRVHEWVPGPGPGDFRRRVPSENALIADLDTYFFARNSDFSAALESSLKRHNRKQFFDANSDPRPPTPTEKTRFGQVGVRPGAVGRERLVSGGQGCRGAALRGHAQPI